MTIGQNRDPAAPPRRRLHRLRLALELVGLATLVGLCAGIGGFFWFAAGLDMEERPLSEKADAIVVPTGGASRIEDGLVLLGRGLGQRLLITGVNRVDAGRGAGPARRRRTRRCSPAASTSTAGRSTPSATPSRPGCGRAGTASAR